LAVYTGLRKSSLYALTWGDVDFEHGTLTSLKSKNDLPQMFELQTSLAKLLALWFEYQGRPKPKAAIVSLVDCDERGDREGEMLREDLTTAGINRQSLHERKPNSSPIRFHDLRATFVTWAMREGRGDGWISDRTGHLTPEMRTRYARAARTLLDLNYQPFPDLSEAIPDLLKRRDNVVSLDASRSRRP
jgi:integrase